MSYDESADVAHLDVPVAVLDATRALLWATSAHDASTVAIDLVRALGGTVVPANDLQGETLPIDLSFGQGVPLLPSAPLASFAATLLQRHLPSFALDARRALEVYSEAHRFSVDASTDSLTGLANRRMVTRVLSRLRDGDTVIMIDLDHFKSVNDTFGHVGGDETLRQFGAAMRGCVRERDFVGRYGGEEFVAILSDAKDPEAFLHRLRETWVHARPYGVSFSAGIDIVHDDPTASVAAADRALYRAKSEGRDCWRWASDVVTDDAHRVEHHEPTTARYVVVSQNATPVGDPANINQLVKDCIGGVEHWPGCTGVEVWADTTDPTRVEVVSWWASLENFEACVRSNDYRLSLRPILEGQLHSPVRSYRIVEG
ncbi:MAG: diguanylate cyclase [Actinomycetota bacterium]|nr:diguanylate cyclase [Actinomycetota bacterium]